MPHELRCPVLGVCRLPQYLRCIYQSAPGELSDRRAFNVKYQPREESIAKFWLEKMVRLFQPPCKHEQPAQHYLLLPLTVIFVDEGLDKAFPKNPEPFHANGVLTFAPLAGILYGSGALLVARVLRRPTPGMFLNNTARMTLYAGVFGFSYQELHCQLRIKPYLNSKNIRIPPRVMIQSNGTTGQDDYFLAGAAFGFLIASTRRLSVGSGGWKRYFGSASVFSFLASCPVFLVLNRDRAKLALKERNDRENEAVDSIIHQTLKAMTGGDKSHRKMFESLRSSDKGKEDSEGHVSIVIPHHTNGQPEIMPAGSEPHTAINVDGRQKYIPNTDYMWPVDDDGVEKLRAHIKELRKIRDELSLEAEWVWSELARKEESYYTETDAMAKDLKRRELELLGGLHSRFYTEIAGYDWMISDAKKTIQQIKKNYRWRPEPGGEELAMHGPEMSVRAIKRHLIDKQMSASHLTAAVIPEEAPVELKEEILHSLEAERKNIEATTNLLHEFEAKVVEARVKQQQYESQRKNKT